MAYTRGKKALYEVFGKTRPKSGYERLKERLHLGKRVGPRELFAPPKAASAPDNVIKWPTRLRLVQFNAGRIETSIPYQLGIAVLLSIVLVMLVAFRLGQISYKRQMTTTKPAAKTPSSSTPRVLNSTPKPVVSTPVVSKPVGEPSAKGNNRIVIQTCPDKAQLEPVIRYFANYGIKTEIREIGGGYYLITSDKYDNPQREGTDGYKARQMIVELGAKYQSPPGYANFGSQPFHDAYGMKFDN